MKRTFAVALAVLLASLAYTTRVRAQQPKTFFDYIRSAYAVAEIKVSNPLKFRDGKLLAFPGRLLDVVHARIGKPQSVMIVYEIKSDTDAPPFDSEHPFFALLSLLPRYSYWRDNLPTTPHHGILGGSRYVFHDEAIQEAKRVARTYAETLSRNAAERRPDEAAAVVEALFSSLGVLREDAVRHLAAHNELLPALRPEARARVASFLEGDFPEAERIALIDAIAAVRVEAMVPELEKLATRDDAVGAAALRALEALGKGRAVEDLLKLTRASSEAVRAVAVEALGAHAGQAPEALEAVSEALASDQPVRVRSAAARGLGHSGSADAIGPLAVALARADESARPAASALAQIGGEAAATALKRAIVDGPGQASVAAVMAIVELRDGCENCLPFLRNQYESHPDEGVRDLIGIMLEVDTKHEH